MNSPTYDISILFRKAENLPIADIAPFTSDPYVFATLHTTFSDRDSDHNPPLRFRTPTQRETTDPEWEWRWDVSNVPKLGTKMRIEVLDEDVRDHDDKLGHVVIHFANLANWNAGGESGGEGGLNEDWYKLKKKGASKKAAVLRLCAAGAMKGEGRTARVLVRIVVKGETHLPKEKYVGRAFTSGPNCWSKHYSPLIGKVIHSKDSANDPQKASVFSFEANKLQLTGPPPPELSHNFVGFAPFVTAYFTRSGLRGRLLNQALHSQYRTIYSHDSSTEYGAIDEHSITTNEGEKSTGEEKKEKESNALAKRFLEMVHWSEGHRIFTYVITLDAEWRFTETGDEFAVDLLSKHGLHSDVSRVIAYSGEFFVRRKKKHGSGSIEEKPSDEKPPGDKSVDGHAPEASSSSADKGKGPEDPEISPTKNKHSHSPDHDPAHYELVIDNDSGTYRPKKEYLPQFVSFLQANLHGIGGIVTYDCFDKELEKLKKDRKEAKQKDGRRIFRQRSLSSVGSSISSSDEEELETGKENNVFKRMKGKFMMSGGAPGTGGMAMQAARAVAATAK